MKQISEGTGARLQRASHNLLSRQCWSTIGVSPNQLRTVCFPPDATGDTLSKATRLICGVVSPGTLAPLRYTCNDVRWEKWCTAVNTTRHYDDHCRYHHRHHVHHTPPQVPLPPPPPPPKQPPPRPMHTSTKCTHTHSHTHTHTHARTHARARACTHARTHTHTHTHTHTRTHARTHTHTHTHTQTPLQPPPSSIHTHAAGTKGCCAPAQQFEPHACQCWSP
jgi:hypothetical protein